MSKVLVIDDEAGICRAFSRYLVQQGHSPLTASSAEEGLERVASEEIDLVLLDVRLPGMDGLEALSRIREQAPGTPVIVMTAHGTMQTAIEAIKRGAAEYLTKPIDLDRAGIEIGKALESRRLSGEVRRLRAQLTLAGSQADGSLIGTSPVMQEVYKKIGALSGSDATVLIRGESGTGKELVAQAIHHNSPRAAGPFVTVNCASIPETLIESELYGHVKGAFTGAIRDKSGKAERADGGTLFLDEIAEVPPAVQAKLLRLLENRTFERVGSTETITVDARILVATHQNLEARIIAGEFREDLYYRLNVVSIELPPLRERLADVPLLVAHFLQILTHAGRQCELSDEALTLLARYDWPGNVRELKHAIEHAVVLARGRPVSPEYLPATVREGAALPRSAPDALENAFRATVRARLRQLDPAAEPDEGLYESMLAHFEAPLLAEVLRAVDGNQVRAARILGIHRTTLRKKIEQYGLS